jgi:hypothetical protein
MDNVHATSDHSGTQLTGNVLSVILLQLKLFANQATARDFYGFKMKAVGIVL